jgi:hypothetical protein
VTVNCPQAAAYFAVIMIKTSNSHSSPPRISYLYVSDLLEAGRLHWAICFHFIAVNLLV